MSSGTVRDPIADHLITSRNAALTAQDVVQIVLAERLLKA
jgi:hypothetical protein